MDDKEVVKLGNKSAEMFFKAWQLNKQVENEVVKRIGYKNVEDYIAKTGLDFENDVLIDSIQQSGRFTMRDFNMSIDAQKNYIKNIL